MKSNDLLVLLVENNFPHTPILTVGNLSTLLFKDQTTIYQVEFQADKLVAVHAFMHSESWEAEEASTLVTRLIKR